MEKQQPRRCPNGREIGKVFNEVRRPTFGSTFLGKNTAEQREVTEMGQCEGGVIKIMVHYPTPPCSSEMVILWKTIKVPETDIGVSNLPGLAEFGFETNGAISQIKLGKSHSKLQTCITESERRRCRTELEVGEGTIQFDSPLPYCHQLPLDKYLRGERFPLVHEKSTSNSGSSFERCKDVKGTNIGKGSIWFKLFFITFTILSFIFT